jgi:hypothetical protein
MVLKIYFGVALLFFALLLAEWVKRNDKVPFWVVLVGALFWPLTLGVFLEEVVMRR